MTKRGKTIAIVVGLGILGIGGVAIAAGGSKKTDKKPTGPDDCPEGFHWVSLIGSGGSIGKCVRDDDPSVEFCPTGSHWDADLGKCVDDDDPTDCPPDQVFDVSTASCRLRCPEGSHWVPESPLLPGVPGRCVSDDPTDPVPEVCPAGTHWVGPRLGLPGRCVADAPTDDIDDYIKDFPTDGAFYQIKAGDFPGWATAGTKTKSVAQNQLGSALLAAAREYGGLDGPAALEWANDRRVNQAHTNKIYLANLNCGWNDMTAATYGYCGDVAAAKLRCEYTARQKPGATGRAIRYLKMHADNVARLRSGLAPARVVGIGSANKAGDGLPVKAVAAAVPGGSTSYPTKWLVGIDRKKLWDSNGATLEFDDARALPPAFVMNRGFENYAGASADLPKYGANSGGYNGEVVV